MNDKINGLNFRTKCSDILDSIMIKKKNLAPPSDENKLLYPQEELFGSVEILTDITGTVLQDLDIKIY